MINRVLLRIKVIQILYSHYKGSGKSLPSAEKELFYSLEKTYDLYFHLLQLSLELTRYASDKIDARKNKLRPTEEDLNPNTRFVENKFIAQLSENEQLNEYLTKRKLSWVNYPELVKNLYEQIVKSDFYLDYMSAPTTDYAADKDLWRKIYKKILLQDEELDESLEEQSIFWVDDVEIVISFVIKTIKKFEKENGAEQELLPMFRDEEDSEFGKKLLGMTIQNETEYQNVINEHTRNWDLDRIAFMDILIMQTALAELFNFPTIPVNVTLNEYIEISKNYSTEKSGTFINGVLDNIVNELKAENKLVKVVMFSK
ncbi:transcription antitermination factor NusB [Paludibacter sp. 221]|uniref:transcription antitermination factor NusB n=1 Tax=Paludibacter sp. 221 TaxID=2302939 RepID=UPI0013D05EB7|nr:transcription antitermination factor NusB [Paludibacter sp. 221]NDV45954.1 transcription antitermination factor NusB [Paludibacter sp. 221]